jgi:hypothetical protein
LFGLPRTFAATAAQFATAVVQAAATSANWSSAVHYSNSHSGNYRKQDGECNQYGWQ